MDFAIIVAVAENGIIGREGRMPWRLPADMRFFRRTTMGKPVIMGRKTYESIGKALKGRRTIVVSRQAHYEAPGCVVVDSFEAALDDARQSEAPEAMIAGGSQIYKAALGLVQRIYLTRVHTDVEGDAWFSELEPTQWIEIERTEYGADAANPYPMSFTTLQRV